MAEGFGFRLKVEGDAAKPGFADNLIVDLSAEFDRKMKAKDGKRATTQKRWIALGVLPAIPFEVVKR